MGATETTDGTRPKMTRELLEQRQRWPLAQKIDHALATIDAFVGRLGLDNVYVSFSGGKDSTVTLDLARRIYPDILAVFCSTGNEYPDIVRFVKRARENGANVMTIRPVATPRQVWSQYGFPLVGKEQSEKVHRIRVNPESATARKWMGNGYFALPRKWRYLVGEPYETSNVCCQKLKKDPFHRFERETGRRPILGMMASESAMRAGRYIRDGGCNVFGEKPACRPLSIWNDCDVWEYIRRYDVPIADIYRKGAMRTGCVGCGFGAQFPDDPRFRILYANYPKLYRMVMGYMNNGTDFRTALRRMLAVNGLTLPDEAQPTLFDTLPPDLRHSDTIDETTINQPNE